MRAMILAAGRGERMRPLTDVTPKPLLQARGKALIDHHLLNLAAAGITDVVINVAWLGQQIIEHVRDGKQYGCNVQFSREPVALETAGGIINALPLLCPDSSDDQFVVVNGDVFCDYPLQAISPLAESDLGHLVLVPNPEHNPTGDFGLQDMRVTSNDASPYTFSGIATYRKVMFEGLDACKQPLGPMLKALAGRNVLSGEVHRGMWCDVGTPARLEWLNNQE